MKSLTQNNFYDTQNGVPSTAGYYSTLSSLTSKESPGKSSTATVIEDSALSLLFSPFLIYGVVILFFAIFLSGLLYQIISRSFDMKKTLSTLVVALMVASIPFTLKTALEVTSLSSKAGPDEVPRNIQIRTITAKSVIITWETQAEKVGSVRIGRKPMDEKSSKMYIGDLGKRVKLHSVKVENLDKGVIYEVELLSGSTWYNNEGEPIQFELSKLQ